jgi:hypothetical protein
MRHSISDERVAFYRNTCALETPHPLYEKNICFIWGTKERLMQLFLLAGRTLAHAV